MSSLNCGARYLVRCHVWRVKVVNPSTWKTVSIAFNLRDDLHSRIQDCISCAASCKKNATGSSLFYMFAPHRITSGSQHYSPIYSVRCGSGSLQLLYASCMRLASKLVLFHLQDITRSLIRRTCLICFLSTTISRILCWEYTFMSSRSWGRISTSWKAISSSIPPIFRPAEVPKVAEAGYISGMNLEGLRYVKSSNEYTRIHVVVSVSRLFEVLSEVFMYFSRNETKKSRTAAFRPVAPQISLSGNSPSNPAPITNYISPRFPL